MSGSTRTRSSFGLKVRRSCRLKRMRTSHGGLQSVPITITTGTATTTITTDTITTDMITTDLIMTDAITTAIRIGECGGAGHSQHRQLFPTQDTAPVALQPVF